MSAIKIRFLGQLEGSLSAQSIAATLDAQQVDEAEHADLVVMKPADLEELLQDAAATAAFQVTRDQESVPAAMVDHLLAGENPVKVWREYRGLSQRALAARTGLNFSYLSQIETGARKGTTATLKKLAEALSVDLDDLS
ncbi:MAG TPA: helix-turn-helix transcriptional regulator [Stellaceae bacterium]|nr:helix-turn-helix transcriptional regulator [Stellaceae bacterium]